MGEEREWERRWDEGMEGIVSDTPVRIISRPSYSPFLPPAS